MILSPFLLYLVPFRFVLTEEYRVALQMQTPETISFLVWFLKCSILCSILFLITIRILITLLHEGDSQSFCTFTKTLMRSYFFFHSSLSFGNG
uniref:Uncharacterized protein n=1 Tax=Anopheles darlingi TaxID=43151 RepID=A0A2M4DL95_ANODA